MSTTHHNYVIWDFVGHDQSLVATHIIACIQGLFSLISSCFRSSSLLCFRLSDISPSQGSFPVFFLFQFLYPSSVSFQTWYLPNQASSGLRKRRLYCDIPILKADSVSDNANGFHRHTTPQKGNKGRWEENHQKWVWAHSFISPFSVFRSVELVKLLWTHGIFRLWNYQIFSVVFEECLFYNVYFFWEEEKNRVGLVRDNWNLEITLLLWTAMSQALCYVLFSM